MPYFWPYKLWLLDLQRWLLNVLRSNLIKFGSSELFYVAYVLWARFPPSDRIPFERRPILKIGNSLSQEKQCEEWRAVLKRKNILSTFIVILINGLLFVPLFQQVTTSLSGN